MLVAISYTFIFAAPDVKTKGYIVFFKFIDSNANIANKANRKGIGQ